MRDFQKLDPTSLKAFYYAAESLNFTKAAEKAALTQSGISQHIAKLEENLGLNLFHRANKQVRLTSAGVKLKAFAEQYLDRLDLLWEELQGEGQELRGQVRYAMPNSCLMTPHFSQLLEMRKAFTDVDLKVRICHSEEVIDLLLAGDIDFGFITVEVRHKEIQIREFAREEYILVASDDKTLKLKDVRELKEKKFIHYPGMEVLFERWRADHFPREKNLRFSDLKISGEINNLQGSITMAAYGLGLGIFPRHCVEFYLQSKELYAYRGTPGQKFETPIYLIQQVEKYPTSRVRAVVDSFWKMKT